MKSRLDVLLVSRGLFPSREKARAVIMSGAVYVDGLRELKPGTNVDESVSVEVRGNVLPYVSRGGLKLEKALKAFEIAPAGLVCLDCGASTGGFTDCLLQNGAKLVYAVDVGYGQLDWRLRSDPRVVVMERTNVRHMQKRDISEELDFATADLSFISLKLILPVLRQLLKPHGMAVCLIKPQFEAGREHVGRKGVVRDPEIHKSVIEMILREARNQGFSIGGLTYSPIRGPEGNIEYLVHLRGEGLEDFCPDTVRIVSEAHGELAGPQGKVGGSA